MLFMSDVVAWTVAAVLAAAFLAANTANLLLFFGKVKDGEESSGSPTLFVGGIAGTLAMFTVPVEGAHDYWLVPLLVDLGTGLDTHAAIGTH